jgi:hypothetical protein
VDVGDIVTRKIRTHILDTVPQLGPSSRYSTAAIFLGEGIILSKQSAGNPAHPCITVWYPSIGKTYDIAESLVNVIDEHALEANI